MGILSSIGSAVGSFFGGPIWGSVGNFIGGAGDRGLSKGGTTGDHGSTPGGSIFGSPGYAANTNPQWVQDAAQDIYGRANTAASRPYQPYGGEMVAPLNDNQLAAMTNARQQVGRFNGQYDQIKSLYGDASQPYNNTYTASNVTPQSFMNANITGYMNPYLEASLQPQIKDIQEQGAIDQNSLNARAAGSGNFGGSRQALLNDLLQRRNDRRVDDLRSSGYNTAFNNAQNAYTSDATRDLQAQEFNAGQGKDQFLTNYGVNQGNAQRALSAGDAMRGLVGTQESVTDMINKGLMSTGAQGQNTQQAQNAANYGQYQNEFNYPLSTSQYLSDILESNPDAKSINTGNYNPGISDANGLLSLLNGGAGTSANISSLFNGGKDIFNSIGNFFG